MKNKLFDFDIDNIKFNARPITVSANFRMNWKLTFVVFLIGRLAGSNSVSLKRLSVFNWTMQTKSENATLDEIIVGENRIAASSVKYEPSLSRSLLYLLALKVITSKKGKYSLTGLGMEYYKQISENDDLFVNEKKILSKYSVRQISEAKISTVLGG